MLSVTKNNNIFVVLELGLACVTAASHRREAAVTQAKLGSKRSPIFFRVPPPSVNPSYSIAHVSFSKLLAFDAETVCIIEKKTPEVPCRSSHCISRSIFVINKLLI